MTTMTMNTITLTAVTPPATMPIINPILIPSSSGATSAVRHYVIHMLTMIGCNSPVSKGADKGEILQPPSVQAL